MGIAKDKLTDARKQEIERLRQFVSRNRLDVKMNSTKSIADLPGGVRIVAHARPSGKT